MSSYSTLGLSTYSCLNRSGRRTVVAVAVAILEAVCRAVPEEEPQEAQTRRPVALAAAPRGGSGKRGAREATGARPARPPRERRPQGPHAALLRRDARRTLRSLI